MKQTSFQKVCDLYKTALDGSLFKERYKAQRQLAELFISGEIPKLFTVDESTFNRKKILRNPQIAKYWWLLNANQCPKHYYLPVKHLIPSKYSHSLIEKAAQGGYYMAQYHLGGEAFSNQQNALAIYYLTLSLRTVLQKQDGANAQSYQNVNKYIEKNARCGKVLRLLENYLNFDGIKNIFKQRHLNGSRGLPLVVELSEDQKDKIKWLKETSTSMGNFNEAHIYFRAKCGGRYQDSFQEDSYITSLTDQILKLGEKIQGLILKINGGIEKPGFFITCMKPKNDQVRELLESNPKIFPVEKSEWLFQPQEQELQEAFSPIRTLCEILNNQKKINDCTINLISDAEIYSSIFNEQDHSLILRVIGHCSPDAYFGKYFNSITNTFIRNQDTHTEEKKNEILDFLRERQGYLDEHVQFFEEICQNNPRDPQHNRIL